MKIKERLALTLALFLAPSFIFGRSPAHPSPAPVQYSGCFPGTAFADLDINNVRARMLDCGDWWWDLNSAHYEIPKGSGKTSVFCGAVWVGGMDMQGQLHVANMTYRQSGNDFWPGPLDTTGLGIVADSICDQYDKIYKVSRSQVLEFRQRYTDPSYQIPSSILHWPGNGNSAAGQAKFLAPFVDVNGNGVYEPLLGEYPGYNFTGNQNCQHDLLGDQTLWWVFNDMGDTHTESGGEKLGLEVQAQAFAYKTNDAINDMTFFQYKVINRGVFTLNQFYWGNWMDADVGLYSDDYTGCDVMRGLGYQYNGDNDDGGNAPGCYGLHPPAIGMDFVGGPLADANDGIDNDRDSVIDEPGERIKMSVFRYYNNDASVLGNPASAQQIYYYLQARWLDGSPQTYGGNGHNTGMPTPFMFPGTSDPYGWGTNGIPQPPWDETSAGNIPGDRRYLMSAGPFTMQPGAVQYITVAVPWARDTAGDNLDAITKLQQADDIAQQLYDNCFQIPCSAPTAEINYQASDLSIYFSYPYNATSFSWNFGDGNTSAQEFPQHMYAAAGTYNVCLTVTNQCGSNTICESITVKAPASEICGPSLTRIEGQGNGGLSLDLCDTTVNSILNSASHRSLFPTYEQAKGPVLITILDPLNIVEASYTIKLDTVSNAANWKLYIVGGTDTVYSDSTIGAGNTQLIPQWGLSVYVKQVVAPGNANDITKGYLGVTMTFADNSAPWLTGLSDHDQHNDRNWIRSGISMDQTGSSCAGSYDDYVGVDNEENYEKVLGGTWSPYRLSACTDNGFQNPSPCYVAGPGWKKSYMALAQLKNLASVDLVITPDTSKWTRSPVLEMCDDPTLSIGGARKCDLRRSPSVDKMGNPDNSGTGMGWFPGYAINLETGERLNIMFGEDSWMASENGRDMIWNPTSATEDGNGNPLFGGKHYIYIMGHNGNTAFDVPLYDAGAYIHTALLGNPVDNTVRNIFKDAMWVGIPLLKPGYSLLQTEVKVRLRVAKPYAKYNTSVTPVNKDFPMYHFTIRKSDFACVPYQGPLVLYPNPFTDQALLEFENLEKKNYELKVYDYAGQLVQVYSDITGDKVIIRKNTLAKGVYIYSLLAEGEKPRTGKFIVQ